jgi:hypothetical protein
LYYYGLPLGNEVPKHWSRAYVDKLRQWSIEKHDYALSQKMQKNKAIVRIARKLLNRIRAVLLHNKAYKIASN